MKKRFAIVMALVACLGVGSVSLAVGKPGVKKVKTNITLNYTKKGNPPYDQSEFSGKVKAKNGCKKNRKVKIPSIGITKSSSDGSYSVSLNKAAPSGTYQAPAKKKKIKKHGKKIVCKKAKSNTVKVQ